MRRPFPLPSAMQKQKKKKGLVRRTRSRKRFKGLPTRGSPNFLITEPLSEKYLK